MHELKNTTKLSVETILDTHVVVFLTSHDKAVLGEVICYIDLCGDYRTVKKFSFCFSSSTEEHSQLVHPVENTPPAQGPC